MKTKMKDLLAGDLPALQDYVERYGDLNKDTFSMDRFLQDWFESKRKLFRLFGEQLTVSFPISITKDREALANEFAKALGFVKKGTSAEEWNESNTYLDIHDGNPFLLRMKSFLRHSQYELDLSWLYRLYNPTIFADNVIPFDINFLYPSRKKPLVVKKGMKPVRFFKKLMNYLGDECPCSEAHYETFRILCSTVLQDQTLSGDLVFSIHPFDFITMSDNANKWHSCMQWRGKGCYRVGTQEMMNSDNVIVVYLKSKKEEIHFGDYTWNSKKWRQLVYVTKPIIATGKAYPFANDTLSKMVLEKVRELAAQNLNWTYASDIEPYQDMEFINETEDFLTAMEDYENTILFLSKGMYNDMMRDHCTKYWCVRNDVPHSLVIQYSGKARCLECGTVRELNFNAEDEDFEPDDPYTGMFICSECYNKHICDLCGQYNLDSHVLRDEPLTIISSYGNPMTLHNVCQRCADTIIKCHCCNEYCKRPHVIWPNLESIEKFHETLASEIEDPVFEMRVLEHSFLDKGDESFDVLAKNNVSIMCDRCHTKYDGTAIEAKRIHSSRWSWSFVDMPYFSENADPDLKEKTSIKFLKRYSKKS